MALFAQGVLGEVEGEAEGVVELEGDGAGEFVARGEHGGFFGEEAEAAVEHGFEAGFLQAEGVGDEGFAADEFGVGAAHLADQGGDEAVHDGVFGAHHGGVAHGAAHDAAEDVASALVAWHDAFGDQETGGAEVVGDDAVA